MSSNPISSPSGPAAQQIGRVHERQILSDRLAATRVGRGTLVVIGGEAGVGKTTLVDALAREALAGDACVLTGHCYDLTTTPPYGPWIELFERYRAEDEARTAPESALNAVRNGTVSSQTALFEAVRLDVVRLASLGPLVVILEDLHWADAASLDLLRYLARGIDALPLLLIATYRDDELMRHQPLFQLLPLLIRETAAERVHISRFDRGELEALVAGRFELRESDQSRLVSYLLRLSEGNALFATELLRALSDEQHLHFVDGGWRLGDLNHIQVPPLVQQMIEVRLARLDDSTQRLIEVAALIGQEVPLELWSMVSNVDDTELADALERAVAAGLLIANDGGSRLNFSNALVRETLIERQILLRRRPWHRRIADALAVLPNPDPDAVAYHLERANDPRLRDWLIRAGERAQQRFAWPMAIERFERAQLLLSDSEHASERAWLLFRIGLLVRESDHARSLGNLEEAGQIALSIGDRLLEALAQAHTGLVRCYDRDVKQGLRELEAGVLALEQLDSAGCAQLARVTADWESILGVQGRGTLALKLAEVGRFRDAEALLATWDAPERGLSPDADRAFGVIHAYLGRPAHARHAFRRSQAVYVERNDRDAAGSDGFHIYFQVQIPYDIDHLDERRELVRAIQTLWTDPTDPALSAPLTDALGAVEQAISGAWSQAVQRLDRYHEQSPYWFSPFDAWRLALAHYCGETRTGWEAIYQSLPDGPATEPGERPFMVFDELQRLAAELSLEAGDTAESHVWLEAHDQLLDWSGAVLGRAANRLLWARHKHLTGDLTVARQYAQEAQRLAADPRQPLTLGACHRFLGVLDCEEGRYGDADAHLQQALTLADACAAPFEQALTLLGLAALRISTGMNAEAVELLAEVRTICESLGAAPTLARVAELAARIATVSSPRTRHGELSRRELDVLRLLVEGKSNQEIASELIISYHTVTTHVANILGKLGVESRTAAASYAVRQGLV